RHYLNQAIEFNLLWALLLALALCLIPCGLYGIWVQRQWRRRGRPPNLPEAASAETSIFVLLLLIIGIGRSLIIVGPAAGLAAFLIFRILRRRPKIASGFQILIVMLTAGISYYLLGPYWEKVDSADSGVYRLNSFLGRPTLRTISDQRRDSPHVLLILVDTVRADALSTYGYSRDTIPFMTKLASEGVLLTNYYAANSWTLPATVTMMTGLYPSSHGVLGYDRVNQIRSKDPTLLEIVRKAGYNTLSISTNRNVDNLTAARGSDYFQDSWSYRGKPLDAMPKQYFFWKKLDATVSWIGGTKAQQKFYSWLNNIIRTYENFVEIDQPDIREDGYNTRASGVNKVFLKYLNKFESVRGFDHNKNKFFFYLHFMDPHEYDPPVPYFKRYAPLPASQRERDKWAMPGTKSRQFTKRDIEFSRALYDAEIRYFDDQLRLLFDKLRERGWLDNTMVIITSDHGEEFYEHGGFGHVKTLFNEIVKIPFILWYPKRWNGVRVNRLTSQVSFLPMVLNLLDIPRPRGIQGNGRFPGILNGSTESAIYGEKLWLDKGQFHESWFVIQGNRKLLESKLANENSVALYELKDDPLETKNLFRTGDAPAAQLRRLMNRFKEKQKQREGFTWIPKSGRIDKAAEERLRALGYLE
ncbi:MAG: sulfatase, partial [Nitrospinota bacterium]|nr:sulfatase [Nitrospinota bacterium]